MIGLHRNFTKKLVGVNNEYVEVQKLARDVSKLFEQNASNLNRIKLEQIISIINNEDI